MHWYERSFRRNLLDFHVDDWHPDFLSRFDPVQFAESVLSLRSTAATVFANTHTGLSNHPTTTGEMHAGLQGRDVLGATVDELHRRGIDVVMYYVAIFADWYWDNHPEARVVDANGVAQKVIVTTAGKPRRFSTTCPNEPGYRRFVVAQIEEICDRYQFEGAWPDMTFWPTVCYCASCEARYGAEVGGDIPRIIDWTDPVWVRFQRKRQEWLVEFGQLVTDSFRRKKPGISVAHQSLAFHSGWLAGGSDALAGVTDWLSADLYGERYGLSFFAKLFYGLSTIRPFEHINSWNWPNIHEHVITRTEDDLRLTALSALMNHGAMVFIDAVDPVGTVHTRNYALGGRVYADVARYEQEVGGTFCQDVGIYYSFDSNVDMRENGLDVADAGYTFEDTGKGPSTPNAPRNPVVDLATTLIQHHVPFGAVTRKDLGRLSDWQVIILPNTLVLGGDEVRALRAYVQDGGSLLATKHSSRVTREGVLLDDFQLADVFGVSFAGETREIVTYVAPAGRRDELFADFSAASPVTVHDTQLYVTAHPEAQVLATMTLPYTDPTGTRYASILTDPPGIPTDHPAIVLNRFGRGSVIYSAGVIERWQHETQQTVLMNLVRHLARRPFWVDLRAPKSVEATLFLQRDRGRFVLCVINYQRELPNIPIHDLTVRVRLDGRTPTAVTLLPDGTALAFLVADDHVELTLPVLQDFAMVEISLSSTKHESIPSTAEATA